MYPLCLVNYDRDGQGSLYGTETRLEGLELDEEVHAETICTCSDR